jgi:hypothetical protein
MSSFCFQGPRVSHHNEVLDDSGLVCFYFPLYFEAPRVSHPDEALHNSSPAPYISPGLHPVSFFAPVAAFATLHYAYATCYGTMAISYNKIDKGNHREIGTINFCYQFPSVLS